MTSQYLDRQPRPEAIARLTVERNRARHIVRELLAIIEHDRQIGCAQVLVRRTGEIRDEMKGWDHGNG